MKIFVFSTHNFWPNHRETELEIMEEHLNRGDEVYRVYCNGHLQACDINLYHDFPTCLQCRDTRVCGDRLTSGKVRHLPIIEMQNGSAQDKWEYLFKSTADLEDFKIENYEVGFSVLCSICTLLREPKPDMVHHKELITNYINSSLSVFRTAKMYFEKHKPDYVYIFNGRFAHVKAVWRAAQQYDINCYVHERGYNKEHYEIYHNTTPHDKDYILKCMLESWHKADDNTKLQTANDFYQNRSLGKEQGWLSFIGSQQQGLLPQNWDASKRNIVIFHTSEDEFANVGPEWRNYLYQTQVEGIKKIVTEISSLKDIQFYLRVHPSLRGINNTERHSIELLDYDNLTIILPESNISSYDLLFNCEKVVSFGSTMGIEAVYWGKPSVQLGHAYYNDLNGTYRPFTHEEAIRCIVSDLVPKDKTAALIYGYYFNSFGIPFKNYHAADLFSGLYKGTEIIKFQSVVTKAFIFMHSSRIVNRIVVKWQQSYTKFKKRMFFPDWL